MQKYFWWVVCLFYIPERVAKAWGMTHHGRIYGVPAWVCDEDGEGEIAPKVPLLVLWCWLSDWMRCFPEESQIVVLDPI